MPNASRWRALAVSVAMIATSGLLASCLTGDRFVRLSVDNPTPYDVRIDVTDEDRKLWIPVTTARRTGTTAAGETRDMGSLWNFRFHTQGTDAGELRLTRDQLVGAKWRVVVPERIVEVLRAKGIPPAP